MAPVSSLLTRTPSPSQSRSLRVLFSWPLLLPFPIPFALALRIALQVALPHSLAFSFSLEFPLSLGFSLQVAIPHSFSYPFPFPFAYPFPYPFAATQPLSLGILAALCPVSSPQFPWELKGRRHIALAAGGDQESKSAGDGSRKQEAESPTKEVLGHDPARRCPRIQIENIL